MPQARRADGRFLSLEAQSQGGSVSTRSPSNMVALLLRCVLRILYGSGERPVCLDAPRPTTPPPDPPPPQSLVRSPCPSEMALQGCLLVLSFITLILIGQGWGEVTSEAAVRNCDAKLCVAEDVPPYRLPTYLPT